MNIADRLKMLRMQKGISQTELANLVGASRASINYYENGQRTPNIHFLTRAANTYGISLDYLCGNTAYLEQSELERLHALDNLLRHAKEMNTALQNVHTSIHASMPLLENDDE